MEFKEYERQYFSEKNYWWFIGKRKIVLDRLPQNPRNLKVLDVGCGTGITDCELIKQGFDVYSMDISPDALAFCKQRGLKKLIKGSIMKIPFKDKTFDIVLLLDVLYHKQVTNDVQALKEVYRVLNKGGLLIITDSACNALYSKHDIAVHGKERYSKLKLCKEVKECGFNVKTASYFNTTVFPFVFLMRKIGNILHRDMLVASGETDLPDFINKILTNVLFLESLIMKYVSLPFGVSVFCIAEKPNK